MSEKENKVNVWKVLTIAFGIMLIISWLNLFGASKTQAKENVQNYLDTLPIEGQVTVGEVTKDSGLYKVTINVAGQDIESYISNDGNILFTSAIDLSTPPITSAATQEQEPTKTCDDISKSSEPILEAFIVSYCPFGVQMQRILEKIPLKENIKVRYMGAVVNNEVTAMHGEEEAQENLRQICIREEQPDKYWDYVSCFIKQGDTEACLSLIDTSKLDTCMTSTGIDYAKQDFDLQAQHQVSGSPTLILNNERVSEFDFGGRNAEAVKILLCCGFNTQPDKCSETLSTEDAAASFSPTYSGATSSGSC